jgi:hypothetical protein
VTGWVMTAGAGTCDRGSGLGVLVVLMSGRSILTGLVTME